MSTIPLAPINVDEDVHSYPRPPALQRTPNTLKLIAETNQGLRVLETTHPPTYYLPPDSIKIQIQKTKKQTYCEWKGRASYHTITPPGAKQPIHNRIWSYENPNPPFSALKNYVSFYASTGMSADATGGEWRCYVDGERVGVQEGDFYGGWITKNIKGKMKGGPGTWGW
jgi:uncharacterized protein (DUF427 family)